VHEIVLRRMIHHPWNERRYQWKRAMVNLELVQVQWQQSTQWMDVQRSEQEFERSSQVVAHAYLEVGREVVALTSAMGLMVNGTGYQQKVEENLRTYEVAAAAVVVLRDQAHSTIADPLPRSHGGVVHHYW